MYINVNGNDYYIYVNEKINGFKKTVFLLHGWLMDCSTFDNVIDSLKDKYNLISFDLLGFGKSGNLKEAFSLKDYAFVLNEILNYYISKYALKCVYLFGHSFGGRIIIKYLSLYDNDFIKGIILCDSAGIKKKSFKKSFLIYKYKFKKFVFKGLSFCFKRYEIKYNSLMKTSGSSDYIAVNGALKATMSLALREDLFFYLKDIKVKTIVAWGKNDEVTPLNDAYLFKKEIENSKLILFENSGHFPYLSEEKKFIGVVNYALSNYFDD